MAGEFVERSEDAGVSTAESSLLAGSVAVIPGAVGEADFDVPGAARTGRAVDAHNEYRQTLSGAAMHSLDGKVALITGAAGGLGVAVTQASQSTALDTQVLSLACALPLAPCNRFDIRRGAGGLRTLPCCKREAIPAISD